MASQFAQFRRLVPVAEKVTYLNSAFGTPSNLIVHEAIARYSHEALHDPAPKAAWQRTAEELRGLLARYVNVDSSSIAFTRDTSEGISSFIHGLKLARGDNVVILDSEFPSQAYAWMALRASHGVEVRQVPTMTEARESGRITAANAATFAASVDARTRAIGVSSIMFHSGQLNDIADISAAFRPKGIHVLVDCTQQVGFTNMDIRALGVSAAAFSFHKGLNCPTGLAALYVDPDVIQELDPIPPIVGPIAASNVREDKIVPADDIIFHPTARRYERFNISLVAAVAVKAFMEFYLDTLGPESTMSYLYSLGDALREGCKARGIEIIGPEERKNHASHLYVLDMPGDKWASLLEENKIYITINRLGVRVGFGFYNNLADVQRLLEVIDMGIKLGLPIAKETQSAE